MQIPFGEWLPDQPEYLNPGATTANNVYYAVNSYKRFPSLVSYSSNNIGADSRGAGSFRDNSGNVFNFVAKNTDIYQLDGGTFTSRKGSLTGGNTDYFTFTQFGNHIVASNGVDAPQYYLMGTSTNFANLSAIATSGSVPTFRVSGVIRDFLVTGNQPTNQNRIQWSGINDIGTYQLYLQTEELFMVEQFAKTTEGFSFMQMMDFLKSMEIRLFLLVQKKLIDFLM